MSFATDILRRHGYLTDDTTATGIRTPKGPVRLKKDGKPDGRSLLRGVSKPSRLKGTVVSYEKKALLKMFSNAKVGDVFVWKWRTRKTRTDPTLRAAQVSYAHNFGREFGYKIKTQGFNEGLHITVLSIDH